MSERPWCMLQHLCALQKRHWSQFSGVWYGETQGSCIPSTGGYLPAYLPLEVTWRFPHSSVLTSCAALYGSRQLDVLRIHTSSTQGKPTLCTRNMYEGRGRGKGK